VPSLFPPIAFLIAARIRHRPPDGRHPWDYHRITSNAPRCGDHAVHVRPGDPRRPGPRAGQGGAAARRVMPLLGREPWAGWLCSPHSPTAAVRPCCSDGRRRSWRPSERGVGLGFALMSADERVMRVRISIATLWVVPENLPAISFYERCGWSRDGTDRVQQPAPERLRRSSPTSMAMSSRRPLSRTPQAITSGLRPPVDRHGPLNAPASVKRSVDHATGCDRHRPEE
jgi:hypothetical protein